MCEPDEVEGEGVARVADVVLRKGGSPIVTADHGNVEQLIHPKAGWSHTAHTNHDAECIVVDDRYKGAKVREGGSLADPVPTALKMIRIEQPVAMMEKSLLS